MAGNGTTGAAAHQLLDAANTLKEKGASAANDLNSILTNAYNAIQDAAWTGDRATQFNSVYEQLQKTLKDLPELLTSVGTEASSFANGLIELDQR